MRSIDASAAQYRVEQQQDGGDWEQIALVFAETRRWDYTTMTDRLDDLSDYAWRVVPVDAAGNDGTAITLTAETIVRTPDAPRVSVTFDPGTTKITISEAA